MSKEKEKRKEKTHPDEGQGSAGHFGSSADQGKDRVSGNDDKSRKDTDNQSPVPVKRQDK